MAIRRFLSIDTLHVHEFISCQAGFSPQEDEFMSAYAVWQHLVLLDKLPLDDTSYETVFRSYEYEFGTSRGLRIAK